MLEFVDKYKDIITGIDPNEIKDKIIDKVSNVKVNELLHKKEQPIIIEEKKEEKNPLFIILAIIGCICVIFGIAYALYRFYQKPDYLEDVDDDDFDDFDDFDLDDFTEDEEADAAKTE